MSHIQEISDYAFLNCSRKLTIDREPVRKGIKNFVTESLKLYAPEKVLLAGLGNGSVADIIAGSCELLVIVEPNKALVDEYSKKSSHKNIVYVVGDIAQLPVDYYSVQMIFCIDYLDFNDVANVIDECKRVIDFEGVLVLGTIVLHKKDIEGVYDDLFHLMMPVHNDFYLPEDLHTVLELKKFKPIKEEQTECKMEIQSYLDFSSKEGGRFEFKPSHSVESYIEENRDTLSTLYRLEDGTIAEPYMLLSCRSEKPPREDYEKEVEEYMRKTGKSGEQN